jgi:hypothetical protein
MGLARQSAIATESKASRTTIEIECTFHVAVSLFEQIAMTNLQILALIYIEPPHGALQVAKAFEGIISSPVLSTVVARASSVDGDGQEQEWQRSNPARGHDGSLRGPSPASIGLWRGHHAGGEAAVS